MEVGVAKDHNYRMERAPHVGERVRKADLLPYKRNGDTWQGSSGRGADGFTLPARRPRPSTEVRTIIDRSFDLGNCSRKPLPKAVKLRPAGMTDI